MTLDEAIDQLTELRDQLGGDTLLVLAKDSEGNDFSPAAEIENAMYCAETTWSGYRRLTEEQRLAEENPDDWSEAPDDAVPAVFIWPTN